MSNLLCDLFFRAFKLAVFHARAASPHTRARVCVPRPSAFALRCVAAGADFIFAAVRYAEVLSIGVLKNTGCPGATCFLSLSLSLPPLSPLYFSPLSNRRPIRRSAVPRRRKCPRLLEGDSIAKLTETLLNRGMNNRSETYPLIPEH